MQKALDEYRENKNNGISIKIIDLVNKYKVPYDTLRKKIKKNTNAVEKTGRKFYLDQENEKFLCRWIIKAVIAGLPPTPIQIRDYVREYFLTVHQREYSISRVWLANFLKRNPFLKARHAQFLTRASASVTEKDIRDWHK